ncbi:hypothetical protein BCR24_06585 [Enterococcus ureilyticus]|uniref:Phi-29-like late activator n=2 Tax=Enterococcus ureilyticus TaxID=1131292 RepID=A0A1E5H9N4_9ENTE|nr:hypothetical protein BCR24_06585 [Enterococcus ureilyticus]
MSQELATKFTREVRQKVELVKMTNSLLERTMEDIKTLDDGDDLTIPFLKKTFENCFFEIEEREKESKRFRHLFSVYEKDIQNVDKGVWEEYFNTLKYYSFRVANFCDIRKKYKHYQPKNKGELEAKVRKLLLAKNFVPDSYFEGDYATWIGVYARPKDKPTYLDANNHEEYLLQGKYSQNGFKQDFSEWFEWEIANNELLETKD